jgi:anti-sigma28 factor (negative regulator of flagellin synthesis)
MLLSQTETEDGKASEKVAALSSAVLDGSYHVDSGRLASAILNDMMGGANSTGEIPQR